jgi:anaphase-promoting complex subunit 10
LTVYFIKRVGIRDIRFYVDYNDDESYTPTKIVFKSGTSENNLITFATMELTAPQGWQVVPVAGSGGGPDRNTLISYVFQMQILENHQNGKDTHLRGIKIYAFDNESASLGPDRNPVDELVGMVDNAVDRMHAHAKRDARDAPPVRRPVRRQGLPNFPVGEQDGPSIPDFMREPEIR